jgi:hypothetical protein
MKYWSSGYSPQVRLTRAFIDTWLTFSAELLPLPERHVPNSIATLRRRLIIKLVEILSRLSMLRFAKYRTFTL